MTQVIRKRQYEPIVVRKFQDNLAYPPRAMKAERAALLTELLADQKPEVAA
jgi:hypothetical protein